MYNPLLPPILAYVISGINSKAMNVVGNFTRAFLDLVLDTVHCSPLYGKDNGFGKDYVWAGSLESGVQIATHHHKPLMVIIHKSWCKACKNLKPKFATSPEIQSLSQHFVMVNLVDDEEPESSSYAPDGTYIPR